MTVPGMMDGKECTERLLRLDPQARVILSSGYSNDPLLVNYADYGFVGSIKKLIALKNRTNLLDTILTKKHLTLGKDNPIAQQLIYRHQVVCFIILFSKKIISSGLVYAPSIYFLRPNLYASFIVIHLQLSLAKL